MTETTSQRFVRRPLSGWGGTPIEECDVYRPETVAEFRALVAHAPQATLTPRGCGRSYGDAALNGTGAVMLSERLNRMVSFDAETGVLRCDAAVTLSNIIEHFLPIGFFFPVTPGTKNISVGGAIAADVHGKNHNSSGSMSACVRGFKLLTGRDEILDCSRVDHPEAFWATVGGMGLTGVILEAELQLRSVESAFVQAENERFANLDQLLERMEDRDAEFEYSVAWVDSLARGASLGRSVLTRANHASPSALSGRLREQPFPDRQHRQHRRHRRRRRRRRLRVPFYLPNATLNPVSIKVLNALFYALHPASTWIAGCDEFFYTLDAIEDWNRAYGRQGVLQYQCVIPEAEARAGLIALLETFASSGLGSFLTVLKSLGGASKGLLSFPMPGKTLALDVPNSGPEVRELFRRLDEIVLQHGGRTYLAKDACMSRETFERMYPRLDEFREAKAILDPASRFASSLSDRLGLTGASS